MNNNQFKFAVVRDVVTSEVVGVTRHSLKGCEGAYEYFSVDDDNWFKDDLLRFYDDLGTFLKVMGWER